MTAKIIRNYTVFMFFEGLAISFFFATYTLFLQEKGLSLLEINILNCVFMFSSFLFEIPTGAIADFFGRKKSVIIGLLFYSLSFLIYFFSASFWIFILAEIIGAIAFTCVSGALEALVVDSLDYHSGEKKLGLVFRRGEVKKIGIITGALIGSFAGQTDLALPWLLSSVSFALLALGTFFLFKERYFIKETRQKFSFLAIKIIAQDSIKYGLKNRQLMFMIIFLALIALIVQPINMYWQLVFRDNFSLDTKFMGVIFAAIIIFSYLGAQLSKFWQRKINCEKNAIIFSQLITLVGISACLVFTNFSLFLSFFMIHEIGRGLSFPLSRAYINKMIKNKNRATVLSFESMIVKAGSAIGLLFSGIVANNFGVLSSWLVSAIILAIIIFIFWKRK